VISAEKVKYENRRSLFTPPRNCEAHQGQTLRGIAHGQKREAAPRQSLPETSRQQMSDTLPTIEELSATVAELMGAYDRLSGRLSGAIDVVFALIIASHARGHLGLKSFGNSLYGFAEEAKEKGHPNREEFIRGIAESIPWMEQQLAESQRLAALAAAGEIFAPTIKQ
jgi:hypothetical protein